MMIMVKMMGMMMMVTMNIWFLKRGPKFSMEDGNIFLFSMSVAVLTVYM